jgi:RNA polymerase sigma-70 factor, ECF subfamily
MNDSLVKTSYIRQEAATVIRENAPFVWRVLRYLGISDSQLEDLSQEVFIIVLRQLGQFEGRSVLRTWLFAICQRVAAAARRRGQMNRELLFEELPEVGADAEQEETVWLKQSYDRLLHLLSKLDEEHRLVFVLYEIEELEMDEIARMVGAPTTTCYSRLQVARDKVQALVRRTDRLLSPVRYAEVVK